MRFLLPVFVSVLSLSSAALSKSFSPLDYVTRLFGTPPLGDPATAAPRSRLLDDAEHVACYFQLNGCLPRDACQMLFPGKCTPKVGHYWVVSPPPPVPPALQLFSFVLPPVAPCYHMMTERGLLLIQPNFFFTHFRLLDQPADLRPPLFQLPRLEAGTWVTIYVVLPGVLLFYGAITAQRLTT